MDFTEISVDPKFHRHLIGKGGANSKYLRMLLSETDLGPVGTLCILFLFKIIGSSC